MSTLVRNALAGSALAAAVAIVPAVPASAAPTIPCFKGYVCVQEPKGAITAVPEGQTHVFPSGTVMSGITNQSSVSYCVLGNPSFPLGAGQEVVRTQPISRVAPGRICLL